MLFEAKHMVAFGLLPWLPGSTRKKIVGMARIGDTVHIILQVNEALGIVRTGYISVA